MAPKGQWASCAVCGHARRVHSGPGGRCIMPRCSCAQFIPRPGKNGDRG